MRAIYISTISIDVFSSERRVKELDDLFQILDVNGERPYLRRGDDFYNTILVTTEGVEDNEVDKLLRAHSTACEVALQISDGYSESAAIGTDELVEKYGDQFEDIQELHSVSYTDGQVRFILAEDEYVEWIVIDSE